MSVLTAVLALAACGSSPPSAKTLTSKIPGCGLYATGAQPSVYAAQDASCALPDGTIVEVATFASQADERSWITGQGAYGACCLEGSLWAATVDSPAEPSEPDWQHVESAIGGRQVSNNN